VTGLDVDVAAVPRAELPGLLGQVVRLEAEIRLRLAEVTPAPAPESRLLDDKAAAAIAGVKPRTIRAMTRGMRFRKDLSRKCTRFDEAGLRRWLAERSAR
jgi:hypothetical protein